MNKTRKAAEIYTHTHTHTQLKRCLAFLLFIIIPYNSFAVDACVENDSIAIVLDPNITPSQYFPEGAQISSDSSGTWNFTMNGIQFYGSSACVGTNRHFDANGQLWDGDTLVQNDHSNGNYCYCRLIYPIVSKWVFSTGFLGSATWHDCTNWTCLGDCTPKKCKYHCAWFTGHNLDDLRNKLFSSITQ